MLNVCAQLAVFGVLEVELQVRGNALGTLTVTVFNLRIPWTC